jgi:UDPglucose 6-dehydrogenase
MRIAIIGAGYVGLVTGTCLASQGHVVTLLETSQDRLESLRNGRVPIHEPGLQELFAEGTANDRVHVTDDPRVAFADADLVMVCVGTPLHVDGEADLAQVERACASIREHAPTSVVVVRSTMPVGSTGQIGEWLRRDDLSGIVTNPEFLRQGSAINDFLHPMRVVVGTHDGRMSPAAELVASLYAEVGGEVMITDHNSAEMIKNAANAFLATKLSFINEVADLCEAYDADIDRVIHGIGLDPRIGSQYLRPGIGFGGSCLPKELGNMVRMGRRRGLTMPTLAGAAETNDSRASRVADRIEDLLGSFHDQRVALLGLAFKPDTDDLRYSPALALATILSQRGASVVAHDPVASNEATREYPIDRATNAEDAIQGADLVVLATEWREYVDLPWADLVRGVRRPVIYDGRRALDSEMLRGAGWRVISVGQTSSSRPAD